MIVKVGKYNKTDKSLPNQQKIYGDVIKTYKYMDEYKNQWLEIHIKGQERLEYVQITRTDKDGNHPSLVSSIWLMNDEGKTIERII